MVMCLFAKIASAFCNGQDAWQETVLAPPTSVGCVPFTVCSAAAHSVLVTCTSCLRHFTVFA